MKKRERPRNFLRPIAYKQHHITTMSAAASEAKIINQRSRWRRNTRNPPHLTRKFSMFDNIISVMLFCWENFWLSCIAIKRYHSIFHFKWQSFHVASAQFHDLPHNNNDDDIAGMIFKNPIFYTLSLLNVMWHTIWCQLIIEKLENLESKNFSIQRTPAVDEVKSNVGKNNFYEILWVMLMMMMWVS